MRSGLLEYKDFWTFKKYVATNIKEGPSYSIVSLTYLAKTGKDENIFFCEDQWLSQPSRRKFINIKLMIKYNGPIYRSMHQVYIGFGSTRKIRLIDWYVYLAIFKVKCSSCLYESKDFALVFSSF